VQGKGFARTETRFPLRNSRGLLRVCRQISDNTLKVKGKVIPGRYAPFLEDVPGSVGMAPPNITSALDKRWVVSFTLQRRYCRESWEGLRAGLKAMGKKNSSRLCWGSTWPSPVKSFSGPSSAGLMTIFYCLRFETTTTWRTTFPYLQPPGIGWPSYTSKHWVPFSSPPTAHVIRSHIYKFSSYFTEKNITSPL
jgi:hypothetical protein